MIIYPAIDLIDGAVVRLHKGDFDQLTAYSTNPVCVAKSYADAGARWLHLVDLNGAKNPENRQISLISTIIESTGLNVQVGGGIRSFDDVKTLIAAGASRVVIGSLAVHDTETTKRIFDAFGPEKFALRQTLSGKMTVFISLFLDGKKPAKLVYLPLSKLTLNVACGTRCVPILTGMAPCLDVTAIFIKW